MDMPAQVETFILFFFLFSLNLFHTMSCLQRNGQIVVSKLFILWEIFYCFFIYFREKLMFSASFLKE